MNSGVKSIACYTILGLVFAVLYIVVIGVLSAFALPRHVAELAASFPLAAHMAYAAFASIVATSIIWIPIYFLRMRPSWPAIGGFVFGFICVAMFVGFAVTTTAFLGITVTLAIPVLTLVAYTSTPGV